jgi:DNA-binding MarR family transcriptional regulator
MDQQDDTPVSDRKPAQRDETVTYRDPPRVERLPGEPRSATPDCEPIVSSRAGSGSSAEPPRPSDLTGGSDVVVALCRAANMVRAHLERTVLAPAGLIWNTYDVLYLVVTQRVIDTRTVASTNGISKATVTQAVRRLTTSGLLHRTTDNGDRRHVWLRPSASGDHLLEHLRPQILAEQRRLLDAAVPRLHPSAAAVLRRVATLT